MRRLCRYLVLAVTLLGTAAPALAVQPSEMLPDPQLEQRARQLSQELRCMVCQNQSIDDSDAPLAKDLRLLVRERVKAGDSDSQIIDYMVARYGEFVLLKPRVAWHTAALWAAPAAALIAGIAIVLASRRRRTAVAETAPLTADEQHRLDRIVKRPVE
jgi:cytochrome c-type biogenesis protein CcmH